MIFFLLWLLCFITAAHAVEKVSIQLAWKHQFQFAGYYAALHKGFYRQAGLDVSIVEGGEGKFAREEVKSGRTQFGVAGAELMLHRIDGDPFVVLAPVFQHSPSVLLARMDSGISTLQDLIGRRVMLLPGKKDADILAALLNEGISADAVKRLDQSYDLNDLIEGRTDAVSAYITNEPWRLMQKNVDPVIISPQTYGVDFYSDCIFTTQDEIKNHPRRVQAFLEASIAGWEYAMDHPEEIIELLLTEYNVLKNPEHLRYEAESVRTIMLPDLIQIGHMNPGRWRHIEKIYRKLGLIHEEFSMEDFLYDPNPDVDYTQLKRFALFGMILSLVFAAGMLVLTIFNRKLKKEISDRRRVEKTLREREQLLNEMGALARIGGWEHDLTTGRALWTDETYKIVGITTDPVPGPNEHLSYYPPRDRELLEKAYQQATENGETFDLELQCRTASDRLIWVRVVGRPEFADDICIKMKGTFQDISRQKKMELQLRQARKMEAVGRLAGGVAHDFNNMLGVILGNADLLLEDMDSKDPLATNVQEIYNAAERSADLTRQLLAFARKQTIAPRTLEINQVLGDMLKMLKRLIGEDIELVWLPGEEILPVKMDPGQLDQLLANLCINARDAIRNVGRIVIETKNIVFNDQYCRDHTGFHAGQFVMIAVSDNGSGMDMETRENLFEPFFTTKTDGRGSGLGLATVYGIMKQNDGFINVYSEPDKGSTFKLYLPTTAQEIPGRQTRPTAAPLKCGHENILLVEDEIAILKMTRMLLERSGYTVVAVDNPADALRLTRESGLDNIDLLITDVVMPGMNGRELSDKLLTLYPNIKCLFMSGYTANVIAHHGVLDKGVHFINKPFSRQDLITKVHKILNETQNNHSIS